jgi:hypothetical protein
VPRLVKTKNGSMVKSFDLKKALDFIVWTLESHWVTVN